MPLSDTACRTAKADSRPRKLTDGEGLYLFVSTGGTKTWRLDYTFEKKRKTLTIGRYPEVGLADARRERDKAKAAVRAGRDPGETGTETSFEAYARRWFEANRAKWKPSYADRVWGRVSANVLPVLGSKDVADIEPSEVLRALRMVEDRDAVYSAKRIKQYVSAVFRFAISDGGCKFNPAADLKDAMKATPKEKHRAFIPEAGLSEFFERLGRYGEEPTRLALEVVVHTFVRPNEIRFAKWGEFRGDVWVIPGDRMKMDLEHRVPLTPQVQTMVERLRTLAGDSEWVLPGSGSASGRLKPISENTLLYALYALGYHKTATVHGFRRTASTILNESGLFHEDWIERQLSHVPEDKVRAAYNAAEYWPARVKMMQWYSDRVDALKKGGNPTDLTKLLV